MKCTLWPRLSFFCILYQQSPLYYKKLQTTGSFLVNTVVFHHNISAYSAEDFPGGSVLSILTCGAGTINHTCSIPRLGRSLGEENGNLSSFPAWETPCTEKRAGYSLWGCQSQTWQWPNHHHCKMWWSVRTNFNLIFKFVTSYFLLQKTFHQVLMTWIWVTFIILWVSKGQGLFLNYLYLIYCKHLSNNCLGMKKSSCSPYNDGKIAYKGFKVVSSEVL